jgi:hypothetical protein
MVATLPQGTLDRNGVIAYVGQNAAAYGLDPAAVLAVANQEGLNQNPGAVWNLQGESGYNFGPPSWYTGGAGKAIVNMQGSNAPSWAWTPEGINYWLSQVAQSASGLQGGAAIQAIVHGFERPREDLAGGEVINAGNVYQSFQQMLQGMGISGGVTDTTPAPIQTGVSGETGTQGQTGVQASATSGSNPQPLNLNLSDSIGHSITQFLLVLVGIALLLGGIYLIGSRK